MGKLTMLSYGRIVVQVLIVLLWSCGSAQRPGFLSIDCGSSMRNYTDANFIEWISDAELMSEGEPLDVGGNSAPFNTMRLFTGNQSKYCYSLSNSAVKAGAFFFVRAWFSVGSSPPYTPKSFDAHFHFKLLIDADEWSNVSLTSNTATPIFYEAYTRALRDTIDICLARSTPDGDTPFISALDLRPLPSSHSATRLMNTSDRNFVSIYHDDSGASVETRYPSDVLDRLWLPSHASPNLTTMASIDTSKDLDEPPAKILQTAVLSDDGVTWTYRDRDVNSVYNCIIYFAEIDSRVNASGQRVFNIVVNGGRMVTAKPIDVFQEVGALTSYEVIAKSITPNSVGDIVFNFSATPTSLFPPMFGATELLQASNKPFSTGSSSNDVMAIKDLKESMNLSSFTGDPCLPIGFSYSWLTCVNDTTSMGAPRIESISLSNYLKGGTIPKSINTLIMLDKVLLDGNNLEGGIPNISALVNLQTLDLSNNKLSGSIPDYLATLENLKVLNLSNNSLTGEIPIGLLQRKQALTLDFIFSGNPLCESDNKGACLITPSSPSKSKHNIGRIVGVAIGVLLVVMIGVTLLYFGLCKKKTHDVLKKSFLGLSTKNKQPFDKGPNSNLSRAIKEPLPMLSIQELSFEEIKVATSNFNIELGHGGFGTVHKGCLNNGSIVAIKTSSHSSRQGSKEFLNEVGLLSRIHHKNLVELLGFCKERELILVYEFMSKGSLFDCLHGEIARVSPLSWSTRLRILVDAAQGLDYLHYGCHPRIIHRDIKSSNILLNDNLEAKISDFGISKSSFIGESAPATTLMGSMGYLDPEYLTTMKLSEKVDVYSFGVLILEVVCGRRVVLFNSSQLENHIVEWVRPHIDQGAIDIIVDPTLYGNYNISSVWKVVDVALACVQYSGDQRPNMSTICAELKEAQSMDIKISKDMLHNLPSTYFG